MKEIKSGPNNLWHVGDTVWACAYTFNKEGTMQYFQKPVRGMLSRISQSNDPYLIPGKANLMPLYFIPFKSNGAELAWSKSVKAINRHYADTEEECNELYNMLIQKRLNWLAEQKAKCLADAIPGAPGIKQEDMV